MHAVARLRLAKHEFDETRERYINRAEFVVQAGVGAEAFFTWLAEIPEHWSADLAQMLGLGPERSRQPLEEFIAIVFAEFGDLKDEAARAD